ncbi:nuclear transport factor 2 family protein [Streptomyces deccanensis]|uniref:nuclear transport factor 2 family protein n=1 Tax=Streptomyces deccanensis TaxID=424188 RepID=UPI001EFBDF80|nr:hypothetical protein [Streptomyces deccanensis]ULR56364.1 hypothetical protein L3078_03645 [Streptomyces deccanensis]
MGGLLPSIENWLRRTSPRCGRNFAPGKSEAVPERVIVDGGDVVLLAVFTHTVAANGTEFSTLTALHLAVEYGRIVRMHLYEDTLTVAEAFNAG